MKPFLTRLAMPLFILAMPHIGAAAAHANVYTSHVNALEQTIASGERLGLVSATLAIVAWVCAEETGTNSGVKFEACTTETVNLVTNKEKNLNALGTAIDIVEALQQQLAADGDEPEPFWAEFGVTPQHAARCATALSNYRACSGFWDTLQAEERNDACSTKNLAPDFYAEVDRRWTQASH